MYVGEFASPYNAIDRLTRRCRVSMNTHDQVEPETVKVSTFVTRQEPHLTQLLHQFRQSFADLCKTRPIIGRHRPTWTHQLVIDEMGAITRLRQTTTRLDVVEYGGALQTVVRQTAAQCQQLPHAHTVTPLEIQKPPVSLLLRN